MRAVRLQKTFNSGERNPVPAKTWLLGIAQKLYKYFDGENWIPITNINKVRTVSSDYTATYEDNVIVGVGNLTITLPEAIGSGQTYRIVCRSGTLTIDGYSANTIKGQPNQILSSTEDLIISDTNPGIWE